MTAPAGYNITQTPNFSPEMMKFFESMIGGLGPDIGKALSRLTGIASGDEQYFADLERGAGQSFEKFLGQAGSKFSQVGAKGSSAFQNALSGGAADLASQLTQQKHQMTQDALGKLLGFSGQILGARPTETQLQEQSGFDWQSAAESGVKALPELLKAIKLFL